MVTQGHTAAEPTVRRAVNAFLDDQVSGEDWLQWGIFAQMATMAVWDFDSWVALSTRHVELARASGALAPLSTALNGRGQVAAHCGDFETATSLAAEKDVVNEVTGIRLAATCDLLLTGYRGRPAEAAPLFTATIEDSTARGEGFAVQMANWSAAVLHNGLGRYAEALAVAELATEEAYLPLSTQLILPELIEAAVRTGRVDLAREALDRLSAMTTIEGSDWAKGLEARSRALVSEGQGAEQYYAEAVERLGRTRLRPELARAHLLYGEWLRRENRRLDARHQLHAAYDLFTEIGADAFAEIRTWHRWQDVARSVHFLVVSRPGHFYDVPAETRADRIDRLDLPMSRSDIRRALSVGETRIGLPQQVLQYAQAHKLYEASPFSAS